MSFIWDDNSEPRHRTPQEIQALRDWQLLWANEREEQRVTQPEYVAQQDARRKQWAADKAPRCTGPFTGGCSHLLSSHNHNGCNERVCDAAGSMDWCPCSRRG